MASVEAFDPVVVGEAALTTPEVAFGSRVYVIGRLTEITWEIRDEDGTRRRVRGIR